MSKLLGFRILFVLILFLGGLLISVTEPCAYLNNQIGQIILGWTPAQNRNTVCKITISPRSSNDDISEEIVSLKSKGVTGILVLIPSHEIVPGSALHRALKMNGVVLVADPAEVQPFLREQTICRPILVYNEFGSAVIAEQGTGNLHSAAALALTCSGDAETFRRIGNNAFTLPFRREPYPIFSERNRVALACITTDDTREMHRYNTPAGQKTAADYALEPV